MPVFFKQWGEWTTVDEVDPVDVAGRERKIVLSDGRRFTHFGIGPDEEVRAARLNGGSDMVRVGKKAAGRLLDEMEWSEFPEAKP